MDTQQQYRGLKSKMPTLLDGQLGYCTDAKELYIGSGNGNMLVGAAAFKTQLEENSQQLSSQLKAIDDNAAAIVTNVGNISANAQSIVANTQAIGEKLTASKTAAVDALAETATQADIITAFNSLIANLKASGVMN